MSHELLRQLHDSQGENENLKDWDQHQTGAGSNLLCDCKTISIDDLWPEENTGNTMSGGTVNYEY